MITHDKTARIYTKWLEAAISPATLGGGYTCLALVNWPRSVEDSTLSSIEISEEVMVPSMGAYALPYPEQIIVMQVCALCLFLVFHIRTPFLTTGMVSTQC